MSAHEATASFRAHSLRWRSLRSLELFLVLDRPAKPTGLALKIFFLQRLRRWRASDVVAVFDRVPRPTRRAWSAAFGGARVRRERQYAVPLALRKRTARVLANGRNDRDDDAGNGARIGRESSNQRDESCFARRCCKIIFVVSMHESRARVARVGRGTPPQAAAPAEALYG